jgi:hypothetical protein
MLVMVHLTILFHININWEGGAMGKCLALVLDSMGLSFPHRN